MTPTRRRGHTLVRRSRVSWLIYLRPLPGTPVMKGRGVPCLLVGERAVQQCMGAGRDALWWAYFPLDCQIRHEGALEGRGGGMGLQKP